MSTDYARNYTATYSASSTTTVVGISNVNDGNNSTFTYCNCSAGGGFACGARPTLKIVFAQPHNVVNYNVLAKFYDSLGGTYGNYLAIKYRSAYDNNLYTLYSNDRFNSTSPIWLNFKIKKRITEIQTDISVSSDYGSNGTEVCSMVALGYESSGKLRAYDGNTIFSLADTTDLTGNRFRFYDGSSIRAVELMDTYAGTPLKINDNGSVKYIVKVE